MAEQVIRFTKRPSSPPVEAGTSSLHLSLHRLSAAVEAIEMRLTRMEHSQRALRRRFLNRDGAA